MIGVLVTSHGNLCKEIINSAEMITGKQDYIWSVALDEEGIDLYEKKLINKLDEIMSLCEAVIIMADITNATPYNCSLKYLMKNETNKNLFLISGYNLAVIIELLISRSYTDNIEDLLKNIIDSGKKSMHLASLQFNEECEDEF